MFIDPTGGQYTIDWILSCARSTMRVTRTVCKKRRGWWILYVAMTAMIIVTSQLIVSYSTGYVHHLANCNPLLCSTATLERRLYNAGYISWAIYYAVWTIETGLILTLATAFKLYRDVAWSLSTRRWFMRHHPRFSLEKLEQKLEWLLRSTFWLTLLMGFIAVCIMISHIRPPL
jgi:hypothetical protein